jgi:hypothetical protein
MPGRVVASASAKKKSKPEPQYRFRIELGPGLKGEELRRRCVAVVARLAQGAAR